MRLLQKLSRSEQYLWFGKLTMNEKSSNLKMTTVRPEPVEGCFGSFKR